MFLRRERDTPRAERRADASAPSFASIVKDITLRERLFAMRYELMRRAAFD
jgi:hypothetical protein